jgi:hypothetical protein
MLIDARLKQNFSVPDNLPYLQVRRIRDERKKQSV